MKCPFCRSDNSDDALVCVMCSRDMGIPPTLIAERDELLRKRDQLLNELRRARNEIDLIRRRKSSR